MRSSNSTLVTVLLVLAVVALLFAGALAMGFVSLGGPGQPTPPPIAGGSPTPLLTVGPTATAAASPSVSPTARPTPSGAPTAGVEPTPGGTYVVQSGDTLESISLRFGVSIQAIVAANGLEDANLIFVGQELIIPAPGDEPVDADFYIVQPGDTLEEIAYELDVSAQELAEVNGIENPDEIYAGQRLIIPGREPAESASPAPSP